jgi:hypothetical protein
MPTQNPLTSMSVFTTLPNIGGTLSSVLFLAFADLCFWNIYDLVLGWDALSEFSEKLAVRSCSR